MIYKVLGLLKNFLKTFKKHLHLGNMYAIMTKLSTRHAPLAQLDRAFGYGPKGREFESLRAYQKSPETFRFQDSFALCPCNTISQVDEKEKSKK